jgi:hypothetical protein
VYVVVGFSVIGAVIAALLVAHCGRDGGRGRCEMSVSMLAP